MEALSRDQVRAIDRCAIQRFGIPGAVLMENAGRGSADAAEALLDGAANKRVAILAGGGNNGGDGFVVARHLAMRGADVTTFLLALPKESSPDAAANLAIIRRLGHDVRNLGEDGLAGLADVLAGFDLIVDAVGGTGIRGPLRGKLATAVEQINAAGRTVLAIDIPTGLDCDTGCAPGPTVRADLTVTFVARKKGFDSPAAQQFTGQVRVADIGVPADVADEGASR